jgi:hypothetical protein
MYYYGGWFVYFLLLLYCLFYYIDCELNTNLGESTIAMSREPVHLEGKPLGKLLFSRQEWNTFRLGM